MKPLSAMQAAALRAVERANQKHGRACALAEVVAVMSDADILPFLGSYRDSLNKGVTHALRTLSLKRLLASHKHSTRHCRYYALPSLFDPTLVEETSPLPVRSCEVMALVRAAVEHYGRAVRVTDIRRYADEQEHSCTLNERQIGDEARRLVRMGRLRTFTIRGDRQGSRLYLPVDVEPETHLAKQPPLWFEIVLAAFESVWQREVREAERAGRRPRPLPTGALRERPADVYGSDPRFDNARLLSSTLYQLATPTRRLIRRIDRGGTYAKLWAPYHLSDDELDIANAYANDTERLQCALRRACERLDRPVTAEEVAEEVTGDAALGTSRERRIKHLLREAAKDELTFAKGVRRTRSRRLARRLGRIGNDTYYWHDSDIGEPSAIAYFSLLEVHRDWTDLDADRRLEGLDECRLPSAAVGQALQIEAEVTSVAEKATALLGGGLLNDAGQKMARSLLASSAVASRKARHWLTVRGSDGRYDLPASVNMERGGWTGEELLGVVRSLYPAASRIRQSNKIVSLLHDKVLRRPNPDYVTRFSGDRYEAAEFVFDRADSLLFAARQWGGDEGVFQSTLATIELGRLRDARFVLPAVRDSDFERRLTAVACLAFLNPTPDIIDALRRVSVEDADFNVRAAAEWAHRLATAEHERLADVLTE